MVKRSGDAPTFKKPFPFPNTFVSVTGVITDVEFDDDDRATFVIDVDNVVFLGTRGAGKTPGGNFGTC
jgi:hypothetical protein